MFGNPYLRALHRKRKNDLIASRSALRIHYEAVWLQPWNKSFYVELLITVYIFDFFKRTAKKTIVFVLY